MCALATQLGCPEDVWCSLKSLLERLNKLSVVSRVGWYFVIFLIVVSPFALCVFMLLTGLRKDVFFFLNITKYIQTDRLVILLGDFNCVCAPEDRSNGARYKDVSSEYLCDMIQRCELEDVAHFSSSARSLQFTHFQGASHARLDRAYVSPELIAISKNYAVDHVSFSDHCLVSFMLSSSPDANKKFSWELWKFNTKLLDDDIFVGNVRENLLLFDSRRGWYRRKMGMF